jgi:hypothetical protein
LRAVRTCSKPAIGRGTQRTYSIGVTRTERPPLTSLGLSGDGDEVDAIAEVERTFGVMLDRSNSHLWLTAGDVYAALLRSLPGRQRPGPALWARFAEALASETDADPSRVKPETLLLGKGHPGYILLIVTVAIAIALAILWG